MVTGALCRADAHVFADPDRARTRLGFTAPTGLEAGMREFAGAVPRQRARASG